jgi:tetratricopeptide (TPR) repeat protein
MNGGSYYLIWIVAPIVLSAASAHPWLAGIALLALLFRRWLPDPYLFFKYSGRIASLRTDIETNPHNATARRELALIYLEKRRPGTAVKLLREALALDPDEAYLRYLLGRALVSSGKPEAALPELGAALQKEPRLAYGEPHLLSGDALAKLGRYEEAEQAYARFVKSNSSSVEGRTKLGLARDRRGDQAGARAAFADARSTFRQLPGFQKRKQWWWRLRAM